MLIGLPYSVPERLCDLYIPSVQETTPAEYHGRHLSILTGRVIDCLQSLQGPSLSAAIAIDEQIDRVTGHLPRGYVDLAQISICQDYKEKYTRAFRLAHPGHDRQGYGRTAYVSSARTLLEAYLMIYE